MNQCLNLDCKNLLPYDLPEELYIIDNPKSYCKVCKQCSICHQWLEAEDFIYNKENGDKDHRHVRCIIDKDTVDPGGVDKRTLDIINATRLGKINPGLVSIYCDMNQIDTENLNVETHQLKAALGIQRLYQNMSVEEQFIHMSMMEAAAAAARVLMNRHKADQLKTIKLDLSAKSRERFNQAISQPAKKKLEKDQTCSKCQKKFTIDEIMSHRTTCTFSDRDRNNMNSRNKAIAAIMKMGLSEEKAAAMVDAELISQGQENTVYPRPLDKL